MWMGEIDKYWPCIRLGLKDRWEPFLRYPRRGGESPIYHHFSNLPFCDAFLINQSETNKKCSDTNLPLPKMLDESTKNLLIFSLVYSQMTVNITKHYNVSQYRVLSKYHLTVISCESCNITFSCK